MKKIFILFALAFITNFTYAQNDQEEVIEIKEKSVDTTKVDLGKYKIILIEEEDDDDNDDHRSSERESNDNDSTNRNNEVDLDDDEDNCDSKDDGVRTYKTRSNWGGLSFGFHSWTADNIDTEREADFILQDAGSSIAWEFLNFSVPLGTPYLSLSTGLGYRRDQYNLKTNYRLVKDLDGATTGIDSEVSYDENVVKNYYLEVPLMLNISTSTKKKNNVRISAGYIQKIKTSTKVEYEYTLNGAEHEETIRDDYNFSKFGGAITARVGYRGFTFFGNYGIDSMFDNNKGPKVYPLTVGMSVRIVPVLRWGPKYKSRV